MCDAMNVFEKIETECQYLFNRLQQMTNSRRNFKRHRAGPLIQTPQTRIDREELARVLRPYLENLMRECIANARSQNRDHIVVEDVAQAVESVNGTLQG